jgi:hypothetical protein
MVKLADGEFVEVIELRATALNGNPLGGVAIWTEGDDAPIRASVSQNVTTMPAEMASPEDDLLSDPGFYQGQTGIPFDPEGPDTPQARMGDLRDYEATVTNMSASDLAAVVANG